MKAPLSPSSASSLTSSFDELSLSTSTRSSSHRPSPTQTTPSTLPVPPGRASFSSEGSGYEVILVPQAGKQTARSSISGSSGVLFSAGESTGNEAVKSKKAGAAKARKLRKKKAAAARGNDRSVAGSSGANIQVKIEPGLNTQPEDKPEPGVIPSANNHGKPKTKTRRGGPNSRARRERAEVRVLLDPTSESSMLSTPTGRALTVASSPTSESDLEEYSEGGASRVLDSSDEEDRSSGDDDSEVDDMSVLGRGSVAGTPVRRIKVEASVMSTDDARSSIDSFLSGDLAFMGDKANKLRVWQALCIELGLVSVDSADNPRFRDENSQWEASTTTTSRSATPTTNRSTTPTQSNPFPETLNQAHKLLKKHAHVNLKDYLEARMDPSRQEPGQKFRDYSDLLHPSASDLIRYTCKEKRFAKLDDVKLEWLNPLLKTINRKSGRQGGA